MIQPQKKRGFRTPESFVAAAEKPPEQTVIDPAKGITTLPPSEVATEPQTDSKPTDGIAEPATPPAEPQTPVAPAQEPAKGNGKGKKEKAAAPWDGANPKVKVSFLMRLPESLHLKLRWIDENVPKSDSTSIHATILAGAELEADRLIKKYFKDENAE